MTSVVKRDAVFMEADGSSDIYAGRRSWDDAF